MCLSMFVHDYVNLDVSDVNIVPSLSIYLQ